MDIRGSKSTVQSNIWLTAFVDGFVAPVGTVSGLVAYFAHLDTLPAATLELLWPTALSRCRQRILHVKASHNLRLVLISMKMFLVLYVSSLKPQLIILYIISVFNTDTINVLYPHIKRITFFEDSHFLHIHINLCGTVSAIGKNMILHWPLCTNIVNTF